MTTNSEVWNALARSLGIDDGYIQAMAEALGMAPTEVATIPGAVRLLIVLLAADRPDQALERAEVYASLPFTHDTRTAPMADGTSRMVHFDASDIRPPPGKGGVFERMARSLRGFLELFIEKLVARDAQVLAPYLLRVSRRSFAPLVIVCARFPDQTEEMMLFRRSSDEESDYWLALGNLTVFAEASGSALEALADVFRNEAPKEEVEVPAADHRARASA